MINPDKIYNREQIIAERQELQAGLALFFQNLLEIFIVKSVLDKVEIVPYNKEEEIKNG